jgi:predicted dithiol-disulfide oxidoreductase (DUF899 family)
MTMTSPRLVSREDWLDARKSLLSEEKELTQAKDRLAAKRRDLPMVLVEKDYHFETERGPESLTDLFKGKSQLVVSHFMFGADWEEGCPSCSFWADHYSGIDVHLAARDTSFLLISNAPLSRLLAYRERMGWRIDWVSAEGSDFSADFGVTFPDRKPGPAGGYNYSDQVHNDELPGLSVFTRLGDGRVAHSYSTYARGLEIMNSVYHILDMTPKGRDEEELPYTMAWVQRRDRY